MIPLKLFLCLTGLAATAAAQETPEARAQWTADARAKPDRKFYVHGKTEKFYVSQDFSLEEPSWKGQGTTEDSLYKSARESLNRGEYRRASEQFKTFEQKYPKSR